MKAIACRRSGRDFEVTIACDARGSPREYSVLVRMALVDFEPPLVGRAYPCETQGRLNAAKRALGWQSVAGALARVLACEALGFDPALLVGSLADDVTCPFCGNWAYSGLLSNL